jgi:hypothetical protein
MAEGGQSNRSAEMQQQASGFFEFREFRISIDFNSFQL